MKKSKDWKSCLNLHLKSKVSILIFYLELFMLFVLALMVPLPLSYNRFATDCAKEVIAAAVPLEVGLSVSQPTKAIRP
jgi:hypothetical protein